MEQKRRQVAWRDENPRRQKKRIARRRRIMIAYMVRGIVVVVLAVMVLLMICGCLYIKDFFKRIRILAERQNQTGELFPI